MQNFLSRRSVSLHLQFCTRRYHVIELPIAFLFLLPVLQHSQQVILALRSATSIPRIMKLAADYSSVTMKVLMLLQTQK